MANAHRLAAALVGMIIAIAYLGATAEAAPFARENVIVNYKTRKCLTIAGGTVSDNDVPAVQYNCDEDTSRRWGLTETSSGSYQIKNAKTGKCLTIEGGVSTADNLKVVQYDCDSDPSRTWRLNDISGSGSYQIKNVQTEKCLTIAGGTLSDNNIEAVQYDCDDDPSRRWAIKTYTAGTPQPPGGAQPVPAYKLSDWSRWTRKSGVEYRFRWGWDPQNSTQIDAIYQIRNLLNEVWHGAARSLDCTANTLSRGVDVDYLQPKQMREVKFRTPNCGSASKPAFREDVVRSSTY